MSDLEELLERLQHVDESRLLRTTYRGRAVSRDDHNLHLAVPDGLIGIPIEDIERVLPVQRDAAIVTVTVRTTERVRALRSRFGYGIGPSAGNFGQSIDLTTNTELSVDTIDEDGFMTCDQSIHRNDDPDEPTQTI